MSNNNLLKAKTAKNDEFYTKREDIEKELIHYNKQLKDKIIYLIADTEDSNFYKYFKDNFLKLGIKKLIATSYKGKTRAGTKIVITKREDEICVIKTKLRKNGDFRNDECLKLIKEADVIITNPPFSNFTKLMNILIKENKDFILFGNKNAIINKSIFNYYQQERIFFGSIANKNLYFTTKTGKEERICITVYTTFNLNFKREGIQKKKSEEEEQEIELIDNTNIRNINKLEEIPVDFEGELAVPITILFKKEVKDYDIIKLLNYQRVNGKKIFTRVLIKKKNKDAA